MENLRPVRGRQTASTDASGQDSGQPKATVVMIN